MYFYDLIFCTIYIYCILLVLQFYKVYLVNARVMDYVNSSFLLYVTSFYINLTCCHTLFISSIFIIFQVFFFLHSYLVPHLFICFSSLTLFSCHFFFLNYTFYVLLHSLVSCTYCCYSFSFLYHLNTLLHKVIFLLIFP